MKITIKTESPEATRRLGVDFGSLLSGPHTVLLTGGMGAGKTAVTKGIVEGMGIFDDVSSPTYTLVNAYEDGDKKVYHFDLYRLGDPEELYEMGFEDYLNEGCSLIIEWPQVAGDYPFASKIIFALDQTEKPEERLITIETEETAVINGLKELGW
ncbi:tRNA (adenosine(37)-N6)-threonylcarbamoyltransferase complex ATPase subunit type 1 TsaE [Eubacterium limosum]|uniref:tRNA threonylcarbamoyladenosine biosynthesis protein TsaE n=1 Tax=Eubacterium limosum TaxID=1736 RepID=A0ABT5UUR7_EUBLI|nr:tRNA (adenosine(37)-N6)-threonylcarbamoyltransferase complex ATPase subunit type 1 TsaE [Eubacterium limosum]MCB6569341.1 tRNA (adenosine(37)-N6)-threonylcarbamoyltransferase complex ATPase subunit type 1 TsaE [Eubacterium limosum]MDE1471680.1 tRNA (adenosine(37)-N6)-threonylcarbamoyltransferase complex ATPase subunit type 1 TsaE [Eubacterium limosum]